MSYLAFTSNKLIIMITNKCYYGAIFKKTDGNKVQWRRQTSPRVETPGEPDQTTLYDI